MRICILSTKITFTSIVTALSVISCVACLQISEEQICTEIHLTEWTFTKQLTLKKVGSMCVYVKSTPKNVRYFILQVHSQSANISLSYVASTNSTGNSVSGTSIGLVSNSVIGKGSKETFWIFNRSSRNASVLLSIVCYGRNDPIPGGCNMEFPVEISPFLRLLYNNIRTKLQFQLANVGYPPKTQPPLCSNVSDFLSYKLYVYYLPEGDFSETSLFNALEVMRNVSSIRTNALEVKPFKIAPKTQTVLLAYPGQGVIYSIVVHDRSNVTGDAAYVPISTYGCNFDSKVDSCSHLTSSFAKVFSLVMAIIGIGICMRGHRYLTLDMAFFGFLAFSLIAFVFATRYVTFKTSDRDVFTIAVGVAGAITWGSVWWFFGIPVVSILLVGFVLGFFLTSVIFFSPVGDYDLLKNNMNYWMVLSSGMLIIPILLLPATRLLSILGSSIVGSYWSIIAFDRYLGTSLSYVVLNVVKRAVVDDLYLANNAVPFQRNDIILSVSWVVIAIVGIAVQTYSEYKRAPFPPAPYKVWKQNRQQHRQRIQRHLSRTQEAEEEVANERTPIVNGHRVQYTTNYMGTI